MAPGAVVSCGPGGFLTVLAAGFSRRFVIFLGGLLPGGGEQLPGGVQEGAEFGLGEAVVDGAALRPAGDQAGLLEPGQVGGDVGLGAAELGRQFDDALFSVLQGQQDGQPGGVGQDTEQAGGLPGGRRVGSQADRHAVTVTAAAAGGTGHAGHGDAVLASDPGEESAGDAGLGVLLPLPYQGGGGSAPLARGPGDVFEREPDVAGAGAQLRGGVGDGEPAGDDEAGDGVQVDVVRLGSGQGQAGAAEGRRGPGQRLADAEVVQEGGGVVVQRVPQPAGEGVGEGVVVAVVAGGGEREGVPGVVQVGAGEQLEQVTLGVVVPWGFTGVGGGAVAQVAPLPGGDGCGGDEVAAALVVDGAAAGVQVTGQAGDRGEYRVVAVAGQGPQLRADGQGAAVGVQGGDGRAGGAAGVAGQQQARGDDAPERASREPAGGHQPDRPLGP